ncbi:hypothetical protein C0992_012538 [Termitomyces sp. T32_za158]|nr:hypothetical protein C0992_012538 [Termitomyces sp. T32_za158]
MLHQEAAQLLEEVRPSLKLPPKACRHRRGNYAALSSGVSYGGGQQQPSTFKQSETTAAVIMILNSSTPFYRLAGFSSSVFSTWAPKLYDYYVDRLGAIFLNDSTSHPENPALHRNFPNSVFPSATYNLGPATVCFKHTDAANLAFGWCSVTALGRYNPKQGGHIVLWECELIIEFPPGSTIFIPSAAIAHENISIAQGKTRYSFTQYAAGGLFRWAEHGLMKNKDYFASLTREDREKEIEKEIQRWKKGLDLFSNIADINPLV